MTVQDRADFVSVAEAARRLGCSTTTVKRRIARGALEAEQLQRAQGFEYRVRLGCVVPAPCSAPSDSDETAPPRVTTRDDAVPSTALTLALVAEVQASRRTVERQADRIAELERENGRLEAEGTVHRTIQRDDAPRHAERPGAGQEMPAPPNPAPEPPSPFPWPLPPQPNVRAAA